ERWDAAGQNAVIWVRVDTVPGGSAAETFRMRWGKPGAADSSSRTSVFRTADGYQGVWHFGGNVFDASANAYDGLDVGTSDASGVLGRGRFFDGFSFISLGTAPNMVTSTAVSFSVEAWMQWISMDVAPSTERYRT